MSQDRRSFNLEFKLRVVEYAESTSVHKASAYFDVDRKSIRTWKKQKEKLVTLSASQPEASASIMATWKRLRGTGVSHYQEHGVTEVDKPSRSEFQDVPMELTKVFQDDGSLELCINNGETELCQPVDLNTRDSQQLNSMLNVVDLSGVALLQSQPQDLINRDSCGNLSSVKNPVEPNEPIAQHCCPLPCREAQYNEILGFLENNLMHKDSGCMYVCGVPGTGKTLVVKAAMEALKKSDDNLKTKNSAFKGIYINGMSLAAPNRIWKQIRKELNATEVSKLKPDAAYNELRIKFQKPHAPVVLIIDELDQIICKEQSILYRLLEWTTHPSNLFSLVCIFNTMNIPENVLTVRNASRMGFTRCAFPPYTHEQLTIITKIALGEIASKKLNEALPLISRKVAAISGDARRAMDIGRRTLEILTEKEEDGNPASAVDAVTDAFRELFCSPKTEAIKHCSALEKFVLRSILGELHATGADETQVLNVVSSTTSSAPFQEIEMIVTTDNIIRTLRKLYESRIILMDSKVSSLYNRIALNVSVTELEYGLSEKG